MSKFTQSAPPNPHSEPRSASLPLSRLALNLITVGTQHPLVDILDACVERGITTVSPWQTHYRELGVERAAQLMHERGIRVSTICRMSGFGSSDSPASWHQAEQDAMRAIEEAAILKADSITVIGGGLPVASNDMVACRHRIVDGIKRVLPAARAAGVVLAVEPLHPMVAADRGAVNSIAQAVQIARQLGDGTGVMIDAYNTWWDPEITRSIANARGLIAGFQIADWLLPTTDLAFDRGMPGDGVIDLPSIRGMVEDAGYDGPVEVEVLSTRWAAQPINEVLDHVVRRFQNNC